jgi:hypothetical protein
MIKRTLLIASLLALSVQAAIGADSGFIEDRPALVKDGDRAGAMIWQKPGLNLATYTRVMVEPVTVVISPESEYQGLDANELKALADGFAEALAKTLEPEIPVVSKPGPGVIYTRAAITNVKLAKKKRGLLGYTPIGLVVTAVSDASGARISLTEAVLEVEMLDSLTGERLGVLVDSAPADAGATAGATAGGTAGGTELSWDAINKTFAFYAERFKARMLAAQ